MDKKELFYCCKTGNLSRIRYLVEERDVDLSAKDKWDNSPLYYACLCGHYEIVNYLLQNGVQCDANTFDGERCLYGALTNDIRRLLKDFKVITPVTMRRDMYSEFLRKTFEDSAFCDISFLIEDENDKRIFAHRSILTARSKCFQQLFKTLWKDKSCVDVRHLHTTHEIFKYMLQYFYLGEVNINKKDIEGFISLTKQFNMLGLVSKIKHILSLKKKISVLHIQTSSMPQEDFLKLYLSSLPRELRTEEDSSDPEYVDLYIKIDKYIFSCHKAFICGRCSYLKALVTDHFSESFADHEIQVITLHETDPHILSQILKYIYTDAIDLSPDNVLDILCLADMFILPGLKKICSAVVQENLTVDNVIPVIKVAKLYDLPRLETQCTEYMASHLEEIIHNPAFKKLILDDANEIKNRQETDTIPIIDDIRYHVDYSAQILMAFKKHMIIDKLLESLKLEA